MIMNHWTTGQAADKLGLSVRTIRYYDQIKLVSPEHKGPGGRRLYTEDDMLRLEKITLLKSLSLPLNDIERLLDELSIRQILEAHHKQLQEQLEHTQNSLNNTIALLNLHEMDGEIRWDSLLPLVQSYQPGPKTWQSFFNENELKVLQARLPKLENKDETTQQWIDLIVRIDQCIQEGIKPQSEEGKLITAEIDRLSHITFAGDTELMNKFWELRKDPSSAEQGLVPIRQEIIQFAEECLALHSA